MICVIRYAVINDPPTGQSANCGLAVGDVLLVINDDICQSRCYDQTMTKFIE